MFKTQFYDKRDAFPFSIARVPPLDRNIQLHNYYASIGSEILRFARTIFEKSIFIKLSNYLLKGKQKQESKERSIISMLNEIIEKRFTVSKFF